MRQVAIYAIATNSDPYTIRYVGSSADPARRLREHSNGGGSGATRAWFCTNGKHLRCYIIEWVDESARLDAEAYWYVYHRRDAHITGNRLVNSAWNAASERAKAYTPSTSFDPGTAFCFCRWEGKHWDRVLARRLKAAPERKDPKMNNQFEQVARLIALESPSLAE